MKETPEFKFKREYYGFQEGARRLVSAMRGIPDRIPVYAQIHEFTMAELEIPARVFYNTPKILAPAILEISERYGIDVGYVDYDVYNIEAEGLGQELVYFDDHVPDVDRGAPLINGPHDLHKIKTPNFETTGRFNKIIQLQTIYEELTGLPASLQFCAPFSLAANIRGTERLIMDILTNPDFTRNLFDAIVEEVLAPWILYQKEIFPDATSIAGADAMSSLPIVNMQILEEWVLPYILRLREICGPEVHVPNWVGERFLDQPEEMLNLKLRASPDFLEGQDPDVAALGPKFYKDFADKNDVPLVLGIGAGFMASATPQEVRQRVSEYLNVGGENGRFALYLCSLGATTPADNLRAVIETVSAAA